MRKNSWLDREIFAIIGGSGFYELLEEPKDEIVRTPFGESPLISIGYINNKKVIFIPRHSKPGEKKISHSEPPHKINYRANIYALFKLGVKRIIATHSCGSINTIIKPGTFVLPNQFIDYTKMRESTFFDGSNLVPLELGFNKNVIHKDMTKPFCRELTEVILRVCRAEKVNAVKNAVYVCTEGPRFETAAEINFFKKIGGDIVGMTLVPEIVLCRELGMCYASISLVSNYAAGISEEKISFKEVIDEFEKNKEKLKNVINKSIKEISKEKSCDC